MKDIFILYYERWIIMKMFKRNRTDEVRNYSLIVDSENLMNLLNLVNISCLCSVNSRITAVTPYENDVFTKSNIQFDADSDAWHSFEKRISGIYKMHRVKEDNYIIR